MENTVDGNGIRLFWGSRNGTTVRVQSQWKRWQCPWRPDLAIDPWRGVAWVALGRRRSLPERLRRLALALDDLDMERAALFADDAAGAVASMALERGVAFADGVGNRRLRDREVVELVAHFVTAQKTSESGRISAADFAIISPIMSEVNYRRNGQKYSSNGHCWGIAPKAVKVKTDDPNSPRPKSSRERRALGKTRWK